MEDKVEPLIVRWTCMACRERVEREQYEVARYSLECPRCGFVPLARYGRAVLRESGEEKTDG